MDEAVSKAYDCGERPEYIKGNIDYLPEIWTEYLHFYSEDCTEYDSNGKEIPEELYEVDDSDANAGFVWGLKSYDDLSSSEANNYTMNDIDVMYFDNNYVLSIEEIYLFDSESDRIKYLENLAEMLKEFVLTKGYTEADTDALDKGWATKRYYPTSVMANLISFKAATLIDLYRKFRLFVIAYRAIMQACGRISDYRYAGETGKWLYDVDYSLAWQCSECGNSPTYRENAAVQYVQSPDELYEYCPHCGAKMISEEEEDG